MKRILLLTALVLSANASASEVCRGILPTGQEIVVNMERDYALDAYNFEFSIDEEEAIVFEEVKFSKDITEISQEDKDRLLDNIDIIKVNADDVYAVIGFYKLSLGNGFYGFEKWIDKDGEVMATTVQARLGVALCN